MVGGSNKHHFCPDLDYHGCPSRPSLLLAQGRNQNLPKNQGALSGVVSSLPFCLCDKHHDLSQPEDLVSRLQSTIQKNQDQTSRQELKQSSWEGEHSSLACFAWLALFVFFPPKGGPTHGLDPPTSARNQALPYRLCSQADLMEVIPLLRLPFPQVTLDYVKLT